MGLWYIGAAAVWLGLAELALGIQPSVVQARDNGQWADADPAVRQWFNSQKSPKNGLSCCTMADGLYVEEDIREGHYWTKGGPFTEWTAVPDDVVIHDANRNGAPVVWWAYQDGELFIRCFSPGGGV